MSDAELEGASVEAFTRAERRVASCPASRGKGAGGDPGAPGSGMHPGMASAAPILVSQTADHKGFKSLKSK
ncbi:unnamed protein product [Prorocentrum cordatum]|uniref:Uncharacterized protein n=1 Tax=Prorocentrum cordatum TaxID=2364126 RepID=A0ABN9XIU5_9DINO|nr:unnamed protein product [Polarella glacialis]